MKGRKDISRRGFLKKSSAGFGLGMMGVSGTVSAMRMKPVERETKLPREIWIATINLQQLYPTKTIESRIKSVLERMKEVVGLKPDIICLPETFNISLVQEKKTLEEIAEDENVPGPVTSRMAEFAKKYNCYVICPIITKNDGNYYNSGILIDRNGKIAGVYHKVHPPKSAIMPETLYEGGGITPGPVRPPVFKTDFGKIGIQISFDANWFESWAHLKNDGAEIVFFASQFPGGRTLNFHAYKNKYYVVSSTMEDARIIDISGVEINSSSFQCRYAWASLNLEKELVCTYPHKKRIPDIFRKYNRKLGIKVYWGRDTGEGVGMTVENLDPDIKVLDVLKEFEISTYDEELKKSQVIQDKYRP